MAKGAAAGAIGGLLASWVMNQFMADMSKLTQPRREGSSEAESRASGAGRQEREQRAAGSEEEDATVKTAVAVSEKVFHHHLSQERKPVAGQAVHYGYGTLAGAVLGMLAEKSDMASSGWGTLFGAVLWLISDEIGVPALKLSKPPHAYSVKVHLSALASHLVYGAAAETTRRALRDGYLAR